MRYKNNSQLLSIGIVGLPMVQNIQYLMDQPLTTISLKIVLKQGMGISRTPTVLILRVEN